MVEQEIQVWANAWFTSSQNFGRLLLGLLAKIKCRILTKTFPRTFLVFRELNSIGCCTKCEMWTLSPSYWQGREIEGANKKKSFNHLKAQIFDTDNFLPLGPSSELALSPCLVLSGTFFIYGEKKKMFQVMLFSMLHYSISQSNNSIFVHQRNLSCLIVYDSLLSPYLL